MLACADPASSESEPVEQRPTVVEAQPAGSAPLPINPKPSEPAPAVEEAELESLPLPSEPASEPVEQEPADPLSPPVAKPGSPDPDAELDALLEESTLTQEEFDAAFGKNKPRIEGDQFVLKPKSSE